MNTHNYSDYGNLDRTQQMTRITDTQKYFTVKYKCCMWATVEYRKNNGPDSTKIRWPVNDDIADARALKYRPDAIIHVYNDINDRADDAEIYYTHPFNPEERLPRLALVVSKNKLASFKDKLVLDLDKSTTTLIQTDLKKAMSEVGVTPAGKPKYGSLQVESDYDEDSED